MGLKHWILHNNHFMTHLFFFQFLGGGTLFSSDPGPKGGSNLKALWGSYLTSVRRAISYRICFMAHRSFLFFFTHKRGWGGHELSGKFNFFNPFLKGMYAPCIAKEVAAWLHSSWSCPRPWAERETFTTFRQAKRLESKQPFLCEF